MMPPHILHIKTINLTNTITPSQISNQEQLGNVATLFTYCENMYKLKNIVKICFMSQLKQAPKSSEIKTQFHRENHHKEITVII